MSKITIANRKFLEEQVKSSLNELGGKDPTTIDGKIKKDSVYSQEQRGVMFEKGLDSTLDKLGKELIDVPVLVYKKLERNIEFDGDFYRQSLKRAAIKAGPVREFFSLFVPMSSSSTSITNFRYDFEQLLDEDLYENHKGLERILNTYKPSGDNDYFDKVELYRALFNFFNATNSAKLIMSDRDKIKKNLKNSELSFDKFAISLFKQGAPDDFSPVQYKDVFDFLSQLKEELLVKIKNDEDMSAEALVFMVVSEIDPQGSDNFEKYKKEVFSKLKKDPDLNPWNIVRGIGQASLGVALENKISKRPLTFWRSLFIGFASSMVLDWADSNLRGGMIPTTKGEIDEIKKFLKEAEDDIVSAGKKGGASPQEEEQIRSSILKAVSIVREQFIESMESESLMMSFEDKIGAFEQVSVMLERANSYFDPSNFSITKDNWKEQARNIHYFRNALIETYELYKTSLSQFSPLEEQVTECIHNVSNIDVEYRVPTEKELKSINENTAKTIEIKGITFAQRELTDSRLNEDDIKALIEIYGITADNIFTKFQKFQKFGDFVGQSLARGNRSLGKFRSDFRREIENLRRPYLDSPAKDEKNRFLSKNYGQQGLYCEVPGRGGITRDIQQLCAIYCPLLRFENRSDVNQYFGYEANESQTVGKTLYSLSLDSKSPLYKQGVKIRKGKMSPAPFGNTIGQQNAVWIGRIQKKHNSKKVLDKAMDGLVKTKNNRGNLMLILAIHDLCWKVVNAVYDAGVKADRQILRKLKLGRPSRKLAHVAMKFFFTWAEMDYFIAQNGVSFFRSKHIFK